MSESAISLGVARSASASEHETRATPPLTKTSQRPGRHAEPLFPLEPLLAGLDSHRRQKIRTTIRRPQELIIFDHRRRPDPQRRQRMLHSNDSRRKPHSHRIRQRHMWRKRQRHLQLSARRHRSIQIKEHSPRAHILRLGVIFTRSLQPHDRRQSHVKPPHHPPFLRLHVHAEKLRPCSGASRSSKANDHRRHTHARDHPTAPRPGPLCHHSIKPPAVCNSKMALRIPSVNLFQIWNTPSSPPFFRPPGIFPHRPPHLTNLGMAEHPAGKRSGCHSERAALAQRRSRGEPRKCDRADRNDRRSSWRTLRTLAIFAVCIGKKAVRQTQIGEPGIRPRPRSLDLSIP
jgi:hypothetical protein